MQASSEGLDLTLNTTPSLSSGFSDDFTENASKLSEYFSAKMKIGELEVEKFEKSAEKEEDDDDDDENEEDEDDFTFYCFGDDDSPISADEVFQDGQIKPIYPFFDPSLVFSGDLPQRPPVKMVFIESEDSSSQPAAGAEAVKEEAAGPYCAWTRKAVEALPEVCKKSNSTGFSKIWRFREMRNRSHSDGRDAFVFLNHGSTAAASKRTASEKQTAAAAAGEARKSKDSDAAGEKSKAAKKATKGKAASTAASSSYAHDLHYVKNRAMRGEDRRRSYLPYKPELVGFFTNVHGGLSKNVHHPF